MEVSSVFRIGEFSKLTQVSIRMLRYYDGAGLLKPAETDPSSGYRLYSAEQIPALGKIIFLRDIGFGVAEIADALGAWDDTRVRQRLERKRRAIEETIRAEQDKLSKIDMAMRDIEQQNLPIHYSVTLKSIPSYPVLSVRKIIPSYYAEGPLWKELARVAQEQGVPLSDHTFSLYHDVEYKEQDVDVELCAQVAALGEDMNGFVYRHTEAVPVMACAMVHGPFEHIAGAFLSLANWLQQHPQYRMAAPTRQIVHRGPWNEESANQYLTEIQIPLERV